MSHSTLRIGPAWRSNWIFCRVCEVSIFMGETSYHSLPLTMRLLRLRLIEFIEVMEFSQLAAIVLPLPR